MKDFKNCREIKDYYQYLTSNNDTHEIFIEYWDNNIPIETAKTILSLFGDWYRIAVSQQSKHNEQEWLGKELPVQELLKIAYKDDKENNK
jgi:hypothetical protein